jgi:ADP-ribosylglycohydrolase
MISTEHLIQNKGFNLSLYCKDLIKWYDSVSKSKWWRWPGPTAISAIKKLKDGFSPKNSGSTSTSSCSATYRVIPLGIFYKVFNGVKANDLKNIVINSSIITHNSKISTVCSLITAFIINNLISGVLPLKAVKSSLNYLKDDERDILLIGRINFVINNYEAISCDQARKELGTGSPIYQTLPLAIYYFLKYQNDFKTAVTSAANSLRVDSEKEKNRLKDYSWEEQLIIAEGGNSDGIAALTGAFSGLYLGINNIPREYLTLENIEILKHLSEELIKNKN